MMGIEEIEETDISNMGRIADYLLSNAQYILDYNPGEDGGNGAEDMGPRTIRHLSELGINRSILQRAICSFYRDNPSIIDKLKEISDGRDYLSGLEAQF
jgi:hypothetical protein